MGCRQVWTDMKARTRGSNIAAERSPGYTVVDEPIPRKRELLLYYNVGRSLFTLAISSLPNLLVAFF